ncbi:polymorphic toxin type 15 domain-containing protein [Agromyces larvae]|uniref:Polymorphic toxin type 15 domain-containing protein n=1 Tax=Agromyces larvae TaxID=2929802 RepID=A0ABY4BWT2_9MICO|nr:polymorphic toxin type 15 domain-containing protein [Agromyces larvae]UOE42647.1 polymorphic toxin type 15 domain-containing protein [Agromyces larvae]
MAQVKLDPARLVQDGDHLYAIAQTVDSAISTLTSKLSGLGGMAGDDDSAEEFCEGSEGYDAIAGPTIDAVRSISNGLRLLDSALSNTARAYDAAQKPAAGLDPATASPAESTPYFDESTTRVPSALGPGWPGPLGEFQEFLEWGLHQLGVVIPTGDEDQLQKAADAWGAFGNSLQSAKTRVTGSMTNVSAAMLPQQKAMLSCRDGLAESITKLGESADAMQGWIADFRTQLRQTREELGWFLKQMAIELAADLAIGGLLSIVTVGIGALATAAKATATVLRWCQNIAQLIMKLKTFLQGLRGVAGVLVRGALHMAKEGIQAGLASAIATVAVNKMRQNDKDYTPQDVGVAFVSAFAGGAIAAPVSRVLSGGHGAGLGRQVFGESTGGAADGFMSALAESGMTGQEFNPISSMAFGALLGGGMTLAGHGVKSVLPKPGNGTSGPGTPGGTTTVDPSVEAPTPASTGAASSSQGGGNSSAAPDTSSIPSSVSSGGSSSAQGGGGVHVDIDSPTAGSGAGGASSSAAAASVDLSVSTPDAGSVSNGGTPDVSSNGSVPDVASNGSTPDVASNGSTPDVASNGSTPDVASNGSTPDVASNGSTPDVASNGSTPDVVSNGSTPDVASTGSTADVSSNGSTVDVSSNGSTPDVSSNGSIPDLSSIPDVSSHGPLADASSHGSIADVSSTGSATDVSSNASIPDLSSIPDVASHGPLDLSPSQGDVSVDGTSPADAGATATPATEGATAPAANEGSSLDHAADPTAADSTASDTSAEQAASEASDGDASDADPADVDLSPENVAAAGGGAAAAVAAGAGLIGGKPSFLPTHVGGGGSTPKAPTAPGSPNSSSPTAPTTPATPGSPVDGGTPADASGTGSPADASPTGPAEAGTPANGDGTPGDNADPKPPADAVPHATTDRSLPDMDAARSEINPNYDPSDPANGYATNCGNTTANYFDYLNGNPVSEAGTGTLTVAEMEARTGFPQTTATPAQIDATLRELGAGSHCVVGLDRSVMIDGELTPTDGHWMTAYFDGETVWAIDAQTDTRTPWPPHEPNASHWDASFHPQNVVNPDGSHVYDVPDATTPEAGDAGSTPDPAKTGADGADSTIDLAADRAANSTTWQSKATVAPDHASDGSQGAGTTFNGYQIPELTPEIRQELDALAAQDGSPIVRNEDGSYSLKESIDVDSFEMKNPKHDWVEFQRQVDLQQQGINQLTIAELRHNMDFFDQHGRVAKSEQAAANQALADSGTPMNGRAVLHGPDQVGGGRPDRFDGDGDLGINSSLGNQWRRRVADLGIMLDAAADAIDPKLRAHIKVNVDLSATNVRDGLTSAQPATSSHAVAATSAGTATSNTTPSAPGVRAGATTAGTVQQPGADVTPSPDVMSTPDPTATSGSDSDPTGQPATAGDPGEASGDSSGHAADAEQTGPATPGDSAGLDGTQTDPSDAFLESDLNRLPTAESMTHSVDSTNQEGYRTDPALYGNNCHRVVTALELRQRGWDAIAAPTVWGFDIDANGQQVPTPQGRWNESIARDWAQKDGTVRDFEVVQPTPGVPVAQALADLTSGWDIGARGFISGQWKSGGAHIFTVEKTAQGLRFVDAQPSVPKQPDFGHDVSQYLDELVYDYSDPARPLPQRGPAFGIHVLRVDDLVPRESVLESVMPGDGDKTAQMLEALEPADQLQRTADWQAQNARLIAEYDSVIHDPSASPTDVEAAKRSRHALMRQNASLMRGEKAIQQFLANPPAPTTPSNPPAQPGPSSSKRAMVAGAAIGAAAAGAGAVFAMEWLGGDDEDE